MVHCLKLDDLTHHLVVVQDTWIGLTNEINMFMSQWKWETKFAFMKETNQTAN